MNDYSGLSERRRRRTLLIVEGNHEKNELFWLIFKCFPELQIDFDDVWIYGTNIYLLYEDIVKEYTEDWDQIDVDLPYIISRKETTVSVQNKNDFINIYLVFDYERHDPNFSEEKIKRLQNYFSDSADVGQLYINYPMIESYQDMPGFPNTAFIDHKVAVTVRPGRIYKGSDDVRNSVIAKMTGLPQKFREILSDRFDISDSETVEKCMLQILSLKEKSGYVNSVRELLREHIEEKNAITAAYQFLNLEDEIGVFSAQDDYWLYMRKVFRTIIQYHICKADRIVSGNKEIGDFIERFRQLDYSRVLDCQNQLSRDDTNGFIWILNTCILLVPDYNTNLISND